MRKLFLIIPCLLAFFWWTYAGDLFNVSLDFCDTTENTLQYHVDPGVEKIICYRLSNDAQNQVTVKLAFVDGTYTSDQLHNKACLTDMDTESFWRYVTEYEQLVTLQPGETIQKQATLLYPQSMDGIYHGCITYAIVEDTTQLPNTNMAVVMRTAKFIDVTVGTPSDIEETFSEESVSEDVLSVDSEKTPIDGIQDMTRYVAIIGIVLVLCLIVLRIKNMSEKKKKVNHHPKHHKK